MYQTQQNPIHPYGGGGGSFGHSMMDEFEDFGKGTQRVNSTSRIEGGENKVLMKQVGQFFLKNNKQTIKKYANDKKKRLVLE
mmetsp:Transcript_10027/g.15246  ORF Transcript_10027/g.15246 Transcript_10027/m.15246 type:complete len:82 (+) Transcript_10027:623-868(+)